MFLLSGPEGLLVSDRPFECFAPAGEFAKRVSIHLPYDGGLSQEVGFLHSTIFTMLNERGELF